MAKVTGVPGSARLQLLASIAIVVAGLYFAREVMIPFALAVLFSFLLAPLVKRLERWGLGRIPSVLVIVLVFAALIASLGWVVGNQLVGIAFRLPEYRENIQQKLAVFRSSEDSALSRAAETIQQIQKEFTETKPASRPATRPVTTSVADSDDALPVTAEVATTAPAVRVEVESTAQAPVQVAIVEETPSMLEIVREQAGLLLAPIGTAGIVLVFVVFMLFERERLRDRLLRLMGQGQIHITTQALDDATRRISRYLLMQLVVNATYGLPVGIGLYLIGLPGALLWGLLATLLRFIPYLGPWLAASIPILLSVAVFDRWVPTLAIVSLFIVLELISNNLMEPWLYGTSTGMSSLSILVAAVFWTWLWGPVGLFLATPLTVCLVVLGKYVPQLEFLNVMLGDEPVLDPDSRFYQRLLATDAEEASEVAEEYLAETSLLRTFDEIVIPAMHKAERDRHAGRLDDDRQQFIQQSLHEIVQELADDARERAGDEATKRRVNGETVADPIAEAAPPVLCLPARDEADEIAAAMLAHVATLEAIPAESLSVERLASEMMERVAEVRPYMVCISALPPSAASHARYLCKRLHARFPEMTVLVGLWNAGGDLERARTRIGCNAQIQLVTTLEDAVEQLRQAYQAHLLKSRHEESRAAAEEARRKDPAGTL